MARGKGATPTIEGPPQSFAETLPRANDMPAFANQMLFEMSNTLGRVDAKIDGLKESQKDTASQIEALGQRIGALERKASVLQGVLITAVFLVPLCAAVVWWSLGERIEAALKIENKADAAPAVSQVPPLPKP